MLLEILHRFCDPSITDCYLRFRMTAPAAVQQLVDAIESVAPGTEVVSLGRHLEIVKQVGSPENLEATYACLRF